MKFVNATKLDRKSGVAERRDLRFHFRAQRKWRGRIGSGVLPNACSSSMQGTSPPLQPGAALHHTAIRDDGGRRDIAGPIAG
jgi:hypothetical protein